MEATEPLGPSVLIAERHLTVAESLARLVTESGAGRVAAKVSDAVAALELTRKIAPDVAIVDLDLSPGCSLVRALHESCPDTRIIVLADRMGGADHLVVDALASGAVGAIYKESSSADLARALTSSSQTTPVVADEAAGLLLGSYVDAMTEKRMRDRATIEALAAAVEVRDAVTGQHLQRVTELATRCIDAVDPSLAQNEEVVFGFMLHDVGKIGVPDAVLNKKGPLDAAEKEIMRRHPELGVKIVQPIGFSPMATDVIMCHHERWNGEGYPYGLRREEIPIVARAFSVADAFDAMTSDRPYRAALPAEDSLQVLKDAAYTEFDPDIVEVFIDLNE
ncbi:MAG TPA: HD domain-containing phosphohydrolase [Actinomycetota bacterium]|nr:HD domain-containing phosphohydrolase [Actinomycetota bacterium]